jgi:hypothetical protein
MKTQAQILADNPNLIPYRVTLAEDKGDRFTTVFDCYAEDDDHAAEQAENSYPDCEIHNVTFFPEGETA